MNRLDARNVSWCAGLVVFWSCGGGENDGALHREESIVRNSGEATATRVGTDEIAVTRWFPASPARVFAALTVPERLKEWSSAAGRDLVECEVDAKKGGRYRYVFKTKSGRSFTMFGEFVEVVPARRIVHTESYDGYDWSPLVTTTELRDDRGGTLLEMSIRFPSPEIRDQDFGNVASAVEEGYARLEALLESPE